MSSQQLSPTTTQLLIVIVNYRTADMTIECLESVEPELKGKPWQVVVVDNDSQDGSTEKLTSAIAQRQWSTWVQVVAAPRNGGFAYGNNIAIEPALKADPAPHFVLLLNSDTLLRPHAFDLLLEFMRANPKVGIAGSRLENPDASPHRSAFRFATIWSELDRGMRFGPVSRLLKRYIVAGEVRDTAHSTDWVAGASMIIRKEVFETIGLMDEEYFLYYEETDFCLRAKRAGWSCWYVPESRVVHLCGQSSGVTGSKRLAKPVPSYWFNSRRRYFMKHHGRMTALLADACWLFGTTFYRIRCAVTRSPHGDPPRVMRDMLRHSVRPNLLGK